jgi:hypothetical protein
MGSSGFTSHPKEGVLRICIALKNPSPWKDFEPATFGSSGRHTSHYTTEATIYFPYSFILFYILFVPLSHSLLSSVFRSQPCQSGTTMTNVNIKVTSQSWRHAHDKYLRKLFEIRSTSKIKSFQYLVSSLRNFLVTPNTRAVNHKGYSLYTECPTNPTNLCHTKTWYLAKYGQI